MSGSRAKLAAKRHQREQSDHAPPDHQTPVRSEKVLLRQFEVVLGVGVVGLDAQRLNVGSNCAGIILLLEARVTQVY